MDNTADAAFIPVIISNEALGAFAGYMNLAKTVSLNWDWTSATQGATLQIPKRGSLVANSKASNGSVVVQNPTATSIPVTLNQHWESTFGIDDVTHVLVNQDVLAGYGQDAAIALAQEIEEYLAGQYAGLTATPITFNTTSATTIDASMRAIRKYFTDQKVPKMEQRNVYVSSGIYDQLLTAVRPGTKHRSHEPVTYRAFGPWFTAQHLRPDRMGEPVRDQHGYFAKLNRSRARLHRERVRTGFSPAAKGTGRLWCSIRSHPGRGYPARLPRSLQFQPKHDCRTDHTRCALRCCCTRRPSWN